MQAYIGSFADANAAKEERMQQIQDAASSKNSKMAEIIAKMDARDEARDEQMRIKDRQISKLIDKLTTMSAAEGEDTYNKDRNKKRDRPGPGRGRGGRGGGGRGGGGRGGSGSGRGDGGGSGKPEPPYNQKYKEADGGGARIDYKAVAFSEEWAKHHQQAWTRSELYDKNYPKWKVDNEQYKA